jgi:hypothetical protein
MKTVLFALAALIINTGFARADAAKPAEMHEGTVRVYDNSMNGISQNEVEISGDAAKFIYESVQGDGVKDAELPTWSKQVSNRMQCSFSLSDTMYSCMIRVGNCEAADSVTGWPVSPKANCK